MTGLDDFDAPLMPPGEAAGPGDSMRLIRLGGDAVTKCVEVTGADVFEHMLLYCLKLLDQSNGGICAFYIDDFDGCDEYTLRVIQKLIARSGYTTSDYKPGAQAYAGFWAWRTNKTS